MEEQMLEELEKKRVEQEEEEYRKKVLFLTSCSVISFSLGCLLQQLGRKMSVYTNSGGPWPQIMAKLCIYQYFRMPLCVYKPPKAVRIWSFFFLENGDKCRVSKTDPQLWFWLQQVVVFTCMNRLRSRIYNNLHNMCAWTRLYLSPTS